MTVLAKAAKIGYKLGRDKRYKLMAAKGAKSHYRRLPRPWERSSDNPVVRLWLARRAAGRASWWNNCYGTRTCFKSNPKPWCMPMTNGNPGSTVCKRRMGFDFIAGYRTPAISPNGLTLRVGCVGLGRSRGRRGSGQTRVGFVPQRFPSSQHHRAVFDARFIPPLANSPRRSIAMPITSWLSKTHGIKRAYEPFYCKPFPTGGVKSCAYLNASRRALLAV